MSGKPALKLVYSAPKPAIKYPAVQVHPDGRDPATVIQRKEVCGSVAKGVYYEGLVSYSYSWWSFMGRRPQVIGHISPPHLEVGTGELVPDGPPEDGDYAEETVEWLLPPDWRGHLILE